MSESTRRRFAFNGERAFRRGQTALFQGVLHKHHAECRSGKNIQYKSMVYADFAEPFLTNFLPPDGPEFACRKRYAGYILPLSNFAFAPRYPQPRRISAMILLLPASCPHLLRASINHRVMPGFMPGIHAFAACPESKAWVPGTRVYPWAGHDAAVQKPIAAGNLDCAARGGNSFRRCLTVYC